MKIVEKKEVIGLNGKYWIFSNGEVLGPRGKILKPTLMKVGYHIVSFSWEKGIVKKRYVHELVALHFIGPISSDQVVNHIDGNKLNNDVTNLEITSRENNAKEWARINRVNPNKGNIKLLCDFGHEYTILSTGYKVCYQCRKLTKEEKYKIQNVNIKEFVHIKNARQYMVASDGRVLSLNTSKVLRPGINKPGYKYYNLKNNNGKRENRAEHRLVYEHFIGELQDGYAVDHKDGDKFNNNSSNLRQISSSQNIASFQEKKRRGDNYGFKYDKDYIAIAKWLIKQKFFSCLNSAVRLSISGSLGRDLLHDLKWRHVDPVKPSDDLIEKFKKDSLSQEFFKEYKLLQISSIE